MVGAILGLPPKISSAGTLFVLDNDPAALALRQMDGYRGAVAHGFLEPAKIVED
jgi:hypothetical protein